MGKKKEREFETGMDEQFKQTSANQNSESQITNDRTNENSVNYSETLKYQGLQNKLKVESIELAEREVALTERRNREFTTHMANLKAADHYTSAFDKLTNLEAIEAKSTSEVLSGVSIEAVRALIVQIVGEQTKPGNS